MSKPKKDHEVYLAPQKGERIDRSVPWIWIILLFVGVVFSFWREAIFDPGEVLKSRNERVERLEKEKSELNKMNSNNSSGKGIKEKSAQD